MPNILQTLQDQGHDPKRINRIMGGVRSALNAQGKSNYEIDQKLGIAPFDTSKFQEFMVNAAREKFGEGAGGFTREVFTLDDFFSAGFEDSVVSLAFDAPTKEGKKILELEDKTILQDTARSLGTVLPDLPVMALGAVGGTIAGIETGPGALITGMAGAFALPEILRTVMMDAYENGTITSFKEFWDLLIKTGLNGTKAYLTGAATGGAGAIVKPLVAGLPGALLPKTATTAAEIATFTTVGAGLEGRLPEPREFVIGMTTVLGLKVATKSAGVVAQKGRDIYRKTGKTPSNIIEDIASEPSIREDVASENITVPRAYGGGPDMSRRNFLRDSAAVMTVLATDGRLPVSKFPKVSDTAKKTEVTLAIEGVPFSNQIVFPREIGNTIFGGKTSRKVFNLELEGVKDITELKDLILKSEEAEVELLIHQDGKTLRIDQVQDLSVEKIEALKDELLSKGFTEIDSNIFDAHSNMQGFFDSTSFPDVAARRVESLTEGRLSYDPSTKEFVARDKNFFKQLADRFEKVAKEEETKTIEANIPKQRIGGPDGPVKQLPAPSKESTANERVAARISVGEKGAKEPIGVHEIYENIWDDLHPLASTVKALRDGKVIPADKDPYILSRNLRGVTGLGDIFLESSALDYATKSRISEAYQDIIRPIDRRGRLQAFREYVVSKRDIELNKRGIETGADMKDARRIVKEGKKEFEDEAKRQGIYQENVLKYVRDSGIISAEAFKAMREANKDFVPFNRVMDKKRTGAGMRTTKPIKGIKGSVRKIVDPIESIIKNTYVLTTLAERNRVMNALVELSDSRPDLKIARRKKATPSVTKVESKELLRLLEPYLGKGEKEALSEADISVFRSKVFLNDKDIIRFKNGKAEVYEIDADLARAMAAMDREGLSSIVKILSIPSSTLRAGAIANPEFMARNFVKDTVSAFLFGKDIFIPVIDTFIGMGRVLGRDNMYRDWKAAGGEFAHIQAIDRTYHQFGLKELLRSLPARNVLKNPLEILRAMSGVVEQGSRVQIFAKRFKKAQSKEGKSRIEAITEAAFEARDVTLDFQKFGAKTRSLNAMSAFLNAFLQGPDKLVRAFRDNPTAMTVKVFGGLILPSVMLHLAQRDEPWYKELSDWERDLYWNFSVGGNEFLADGTRNPDFIIHKIPKPFEPGLLFATGAERMVEWAITTSSDSAQAARDFLKTMAKSVIPNAIPQALGVPLEAYFNKSIFLDRPIIPRDREGLLPELQHGIYTSETAKQIAKFIGVLPLVGDTVLASGAIVEHVIRGWTGGLGKHALDLIDKALVASGVVPDDIEPTPQDLTNIPLVKAFVVRHPSLNTKPIERFYQIFEKQERIINSYKALRKEGEIARAQAIFKEAQQAGGIFRLEKQRKSMANMSKMIRRISRIKKMDGMTRDELADWKRENIDSLYFRMNQVAKIGLKIADTFERSIAR